MRLLHLVSIGVLLSSLAFADSYTVSPLTGGPKILNLESGQYVGNGWLIARGIDDAGVGIGEYFSTNGNPPIVSPFREQNLAFFGSPTNPTMGPQVVATAISSNGLYTAGLYEPLTPGQGSFMYLQQGSSAPQKLDLPVDTYGFGTGPSSYIAGVNNSGTVVANVEAGLSYLSSAQVISNGVATTLQFPGAVYTRVGGINDNGVIVGNATVGTASLLNAFVVFTYQNGVFTTVYSTPFSSTQFWPMGINNSGQIVGTIDPFDIARQYAALLDNGVVTNLNSFYTNNPNPYYPFQFAVAAGINNRGEIIGEDRAGSVLVATPASLAQVPEPGTLGLLAASVLFGTAMQRRSSKC